jgi:hypothetical protein
MEQPKLEVAQSPTIRLAIEWTPGAGRIEFQWPQVDDVLKLGMLEMAKVVLAEQRQKSGMANGTPLIMPARIVQ